MLDILLPGMDGWEICREVRKVSDVPLLIGLIGSEAQIAAVARAFKVHRLKVLQAGQDADDYLVDHGSITYLMDPRSAFVSLFPYSTTASFMAEAIAKYFDLEAAF